MFEFNAQRRLDLLKSKMESMVHTHKRTTRRREDPIPLTERSQSAMLAGSSTRKEDRTGRS